MRLVAVIAIVAVLCAASAHALSAGKLKRMHTALQSRHSKVLAAQHQHQTQGQAQAQEQERVEFIIKIGNFEGMDAGCSHAHVGDAKCKQLTDAAAEATTKINAMLTHLNAHHRDAKFTAAFGTADESAVKTCLEHAAKDTSKMMLWNTYANKDGSVHTGSGLAWAGFGILGGGTKLYVGPNAYSFSKKEMAEHLIHEASHAFCATIDAHGPSKQSGYKDSGHFDTWKGANNADSYRVYAQSV